MTHQALPSIPSHLALCLLGAVLLTTSCGSATTGLDERCADLAATGYDQQIQIRALLQATHQPNTGDPGALRHRAKNVCQKLGSGSQPNP